MHRTPGSKPQERQSLFFRDLASPISAQRSSRLATPGKAAAVSALWRESFSGAFDNPPPPPVFTLEDRIDFSPEHPLHELPPASPESAPEPKTPTPVRNYLSTPSLIRTRAGARAAEGSANGGIEKSTPGSGGWWAPHPGSEEKGKGSPVDGVVKSSGAGTGQLVMLPLPREVARPEMKQSQLVPAKDGMLDEEEWVVVYGYDGLFSALEFCICYITSSITHNDLTCHFWLCQKITCFLKFNLRFFFFFLFERKTT